MQNVLRVVLFSWYLLMGAGLSVQTHFCMDRLASIRFFAEKADSCADTCLLSCCYDLNQELRLEAAHVAADFQAAQPLFDWAELPLAAACCQILLPAAEAPLRLPDPGPPLPSAPRYLLHHSLVYYG
jgi:hypothetical protein